MPKSWWIYPTDSGGYKIHKAGGILRGMGGLGWLQRLNHGYAYRLEIYD